MYPSSGGDTRSCDHDRLEKDWHCPHSVVEEILAVADTHGTMHPRYRASSSVMRGNWGHADSDSTGDPDRAWSVPATPATHAGSNWPPTPVMMNDEELLAEMALLKKCECDLPAVACRRDPLASATRAKIRCALSAMLAQCEIWRWHVRRGGVREGGHLTSHATALV